VIGENAKTGQVMGGGSSRVNPHYVVSPLDGIRVRVGDQAHIHYEIGTPIFKAPPLLDLDWLTTLDGQSKGLTLEYFAGMSLAGDPVHRQVIDKTALNWFGYVDPYVDPADFSCRLSATLSVPESRVYEFQLSSVGQSRMILDDVVQIDLWSPDEESKTGSVSLELEAGRSYSLVLEYITNPEARFRNLRLSCLPTLPDDPIRAAVDAAAAADVAVVVAGLSHEWESEGFDRPDLELVGRQNELISRVVEANPNTVVVLNAGSALTMPWIADVKAVLEQWYGGQEAGNALADVLFGDRSPSGKLPTTFPVRFEDNPAFINYPGENGEVHYGENIFVGYRYYDEKNVEPLFPFGHGLSYTTFAYDNVRLNGKSFGPNDEIVVSVDVSNTGDKVGQEIVQLYVKDIESRLRRPVKELKAFSKVGLNPGETKTVELVLNRQALAFYDPQEAEWVTEAGKFEVLVGASSRDIRGKATFTWLGDTGSKS
jgi:beta-glucosidase